MPFPRHLHGLPTFIYKPLEWRLKVVVPADSSPCDCIYPGLGISDTLIEKKKVIDIETGKYPKCAEDGE